MNPKAAQLLADLQAAGVITGTPQFIKPVPDKRVYVRAGIVAATDETEKIEIAGLHCGVTQETEREARIFVFKDGKSVGPYYLHPSEVL